MRPQLYETLCDAYALADEDEDMATMDAASDKTINAAKNGFDLREIFERALCFLLWASCDLSERRYALLSGSVALEACMASSLSHRMAFLQNQSSATIWQKVCMKDKVGYIWIRCPFAFEGE